MNETFKSISERQADFEDLWTNKAKHFTKAPILADIRPHLEGIGFFTAPASTKYHGAYEGGLYDHSRMVFLRLQDLTNKLNLQWERPESPFIIGMFHDLCKCDQYNLITDADYSGCENPELATEEDIKNGYKLASHYEYNTKTLLKGHGSKSVMLLSKYMQLTEEEMLCIRYHMGAYGNEHEQKDEWAGFDLAIRKYPNVFYTHAADMIASKIDDI